MEKKPSQTTVWPQARQIGMQMASSQIPSQNTFRLGKLMFSSDFDSGNLAHVEEVTPFDQYAMIVQMGQQTLKRVFDLYICPDPALSSCATLGLSGNPLLVEEGDDYQSYRAWFHFFVQGFQPGETVEFVIKNMSNQRQ